MKLLTSSAERRLLLIYHSSPPPQLSHSAAAQAVTTVKVTLAMANNKRAGYSHIIHKSENIWLPTAQGA